MKIEQNKDAPSFEKISACVHCGLCLEACPTYRELRVEMDSPRGRIYLMKGILDERIEPTEDVLGHHPHRAWNTGRSSRRPARCWNRSGATG
jgi:Fe-S oxidoreductase